MAGHRWFDGICIGIVILTLIITILFMNGEALGLAPIIDAESADTLFTANDLNESWDTEGATRITLSGDSASISGNGAYFYDGSLHIVYAGNYVVTGSMNGGSIVVNADGDDKIWILLDGVSVYAEDDAAIRVEQAKKVFLTLSGENKLESGAQYDAKKVSDGIDGVIYSRDDLTINGSGSLAVTANYKHGIVCNDDLVMTGGTISVTAPEDGIHANDSVRVRAADITIRAGDDGMTASNDEETSFLYIESGNIQITDCYEGLEAVQVTIAGGRVEIHSSDDGINANGSGGDSLISITGGDITILNSSGRDADGLDSNGSIAISGGELLISLTGTGSNCALDCGKESGGTCTITGGTVIACGGSSMAEGFDNSSSQASFMQTFGATADGDVLTVTDAGGNVILSRQIPYSFTSAVVSTPDLVFGDTYTVSAGGTTAEITADSSAASAFGGMGHTGGFGNKGDRNQMPGAGGMPEMNRDPAMADDESVQPPEIPGEGQNGFGDKEGQRPNDRWNMEDQAGDRDNPRSDGLPDSASSASGTVTSSQWILTALSVLILGAGLLVAFKKKA